MRPLLQVAALRLRPHLRGAHLGHADAEDLFDRSGDLGLVGAVVDPERVLAFGDQRVALLRDDRADDDVARVHQPSLSFSVSSAFSESTSEAAPITSATPIAPTSATVTRAMLRKLLSAPVSSASRTTSVGRFAPHFSSACAAALVDGRLEGGGVEHGDAAPLGVDRERRPHRLAACFAVDLDRVVPRLGTEGDAAAEAAGNAERADAGAAGALLTPGLGGGEGDLAAGQGRGGAATARGEVGARRLVHQRLVERLGEELFRQVRFGRLAEHRRFSHRSSPRSARCASRAPSP